MPKLSFEPVMATGAGIRFPRKNKKPAAKTAYPQGTFFCSRSIMQSILFRNLGFASQPFG